MRNKQIFMAHLNHCCTCPHALHIYVKGQLLNIFAADYLKIVRSSSLKTHISLLRRQLNPGIIIFFHFLASVGFNSHIKSVL